MRMLTEVTPKREELLVHPMYYAIHSLEQVRTFMEFHVFAVCDFMWLLKSLQKELTCCDVPWRPSQNWLSCRIINEIVLEEESDEGPEGTYWSHYEMYRAAMAKAGADTTTVDKFFDMLEKGYSVEGALYKLPIAKTTKSFVLSTWNTIQSGSLPAIAASFAVARENVIPDMFTQLIGKIHSSHPQELDLYLEYLNRHIELDGEEHGTATLHVLNEVCHNSPQAWREAKESAERALEARIKLWDGAFEAITDSPLVASSSSRLWERFAKTEP